MNCQERDLPLSGAGREELATIYSWSTSEAIAAHNEWEKEEHHLAAKGPILRWVAANELKKLSGDYETSKDKAIITAALFICAMNDLPIPQWCAVAFINAYRDVWFRAAVSWDDVLGKPHPKGTHTNDFREFRRNAFVVAEKIDEIRKDEPGTPIDGNLYERVGRELGLGGKTKIQKLHRYAKEWKKFSTLK